MTVTKEQASEALDLIWSITHSGEAERTLRQFIEQSQDSGHAPAPTQQPTALEAVAKAIYEQWAHIDGWKPWVAGGNATKQDEARSIARAALAGAAPTPQPEFDRDTDGELLIDWSPAKGRMLSVSLRDDGRLSYAFIWDGEKAHGTAQMPAGAAPTQAPQQPTLSERLQQKCSDWGTYWRAPDAHGVVLSQDQALELLRDALGVEVEFATSTEAVQGKENQQ